MLADESVRKQVADWCRTEGIDAPGVSFDGSTVVLSGRVPTLRHSRLLERELLQQPGVESVVTSTLEVATRRSDAEVLADALEVLAACNCPHVGLDVFEGVVTLTGDEPNLMSLQLLEDQLCGVLGVVDIRSTVTLAPAVETFDRVSQTAPAGA